MQRIEKKIDEGLLLAAWNPTKVGLVYVKKILVVMFL